SWCDLCSRMRSSWARSVFVRGRGWRLHCFFFFSSRRRHTRSKRDWSSDVCSSDLSKTQPNLPTLGFRGTLRFIWTQLTSMRTALMLLLLLAVAAVPGSLFPQRRAGADIVETWIEDTPTLWPILDALGMFDVYNSVWFSAVYLLLMGSLVGCLWPRALQHLKALRQPPARTPRNLQRLPEYGQLVLEADGPTPDQALVDAERILKKAGYRTELRDGSVGAERGYTREIGNILFH